MRKRLFHSVQPVERAVQRRQAWEILYDLSSSARASFEAVKFLRSQRLGDDEVYAIVRLSLCLEEPLKTRVRNLLKRIVQHRKMTWPCHQASLSLPLLSHGSFSSSVDRWLRSLVLQSGLFLCHHLPSVRVREAALQSCKDLLHNVPIWDIFLQQHGDVNLPCKCSNLQIPEECFVDGHLAAGFEQLASLHQDL